MGNVGVRDSGHSFGDRDKKCNLNSTPVVDVTDCFIIIVETTGTYAYHNVKYNCNDTVPNDTGTTPSEGIGVSNVKMSQC